MARKITLIVFLMVMVAAGVATPRPRDDIDSMWQAWKTKYNRVYRTRSDESAKRAVFVNNAAVVREWNANASEPDAVRLELNGFADMTHDEYLHTLTLTVPLQQQRRPGPLMASVAAPLPASIDYRTLGCVGPVRDQGRCGSCWAHSVADVVGGALAKSGRPYIDLSVQQLLDCSTQDYGCGGGDTVSAIEFVQRRGLMNESAYPYAAIAGACRYRTAAATAHIGGHILLPNDERALAAALVARGTIAVAINASPSSMQFYSTGIYRDRSCIGTMAALNHAVVLAGYTRDSWILKNSWGSDWGRQGYLYLARNSGNLCGVATYSVAMVA